MVGKDWEFRKIFIIRWKDVKESDRNFITKNIICKVKNSLERFNNKQHSKRKKKFSWIGQWKLSSLKHNGDKKWKQNRSSENYGTICNLSPRKRTEKIIGQSYMWRDNSRKFFKREGRYKSILSIILKIHKQNLLGKERTLHLHI